MEQRRSRLVAPDATGLRARILSTGGLLAVAGMVVVALVQLFPRQELMERLRAEPRNDELSVSYLANLLTSEPDNDELRMLLAERHFALKQADRAEAALAPMQGRLIASTETRLRLSRLNYQLLELRANAAPPGSDAAHLLRLQQVSALQDRLLLEWPTPDLLDWARKAVALEQLGLAQRFHARIRFDADADADRQPWFAEAVRTAIWAQDHAGAAQLHARAIEVVPPERRRQHLREALRILQSGNRLGEALALAARHDALVGDDREMLEYLTRLALAAGRHDEADRYARRLLRMGAQAPGSPAWLTAIGPWVEALLPAAQAAPASPPSPASPAPSASAPEGAAAPLLPPAGVGDPRLPFDDEAYTLAWQTFLASRRLDEAWRVAAAAVRQRPQDTVWMERLAQVDEWSGRAAQSLPLWQELARLATLSRDAALQQRALAGVQRLAPGLNDDEALLATWREVAQLRRLGDDEVLGLVAMTERLGRPEEGLVWLREAQRRQASSRLLQAEADLDERMGEMPAAIDALRRLAARDGMTPARSARLATLLALRADPQAAFETMQPLAARVPPDDIAWWRLMGSLAWTLQRETEARQALAIVTAREDFDATEADRQIQLLRESDPGAAAAFAERAWRRLKLDGYLLTALDLRWERRDLAGMEALFAAVDGEALQRLDRESYFWMLRAQWRQARGELLAAVADMRRALDAAPDHVGTRTAFLFLLVESGGRGELQRLLGTWLEEAQADPAYDAAYAAGYVELDLPRRALPFWRRQAPLHRDDALWNAAYADVLDAAGQGAAGQAVRHHALELTRRQLRALALRTDTKAPAERQALRLQRARLLLATSQGDGDLRVIRDLLAPGGLVGDSSDPRVAEAARDLVLDWLMASERHDEARLWLWRHHGRTVLTPTWISMAMALHEGDLDEVGRLLERPDGVRLPPALQAEALQALGHDGRAQALRASWLELHDDDALHEAHAEVAWARSRRVEFGLEHRRDGLRADVLSLGLQLPLGERSRLALQARHARQHGDGLALGQVAAVDREIGATLQWQPDRAIDTELSLGARSAERDFPTAALTLALRPLSRLQLRASAVLNARADDSTALAAAGRRSGVQLEADWRLSTFNPVRLALRSDRLSLQDGTALGRATRLDWQVAQVLRGAAPDLSLRLFGQYGRYRADAGPLPGWTAALTADASLPGSGFFVPDDYALHGIGLSAGLGAREGFSRAWRPFVDADLTTHSRLGRGWSAGIGAAGRLFGGDRLMVQWNATRSGPGGDSRAISVRYLLPF